MKIIKGDLIQLSIDGEFDVIAQGCNCFNTQKSGIAAQFVKHFGTNTFPMEEPEYYGDYSKLGNIDYKSMIVGHSYELTVVNCYTQHSFGRNKHKIYANYSAISLCMQKIANKFSGSKIGVPLVGGGLANGNKVIIIESMKQAFENVDAALVIKDNSVIESLEMMGYVCH